MRGSSPRMTRMRHVMAGLDPAISLLAATGRRQDRRCAYAGAFGELSPLLGACCPIFLPPLEKLIGDRSGQGDGNDDDGKCGKGRRRSLANPAGENRHQRLVGENGEGRGVVILEGREKSDHGRGEKRRFEKWNENVPEHLRIAGAKIESRFFLSAVEPLQSR